MNNRRHNAQSEDLIVPFHKGCVNHRLYKISKIPIMYHVKVKSKANPHLAEFDKYFYQRTKWREDIAKKCKQNTTFVSSKNAKQNTAG